MHVLSYTFENNFLMSYCNTYNKVVWYGVYHVSFSDFWILYVVNLIIQNFVVIVIVNGWINSFL